MSANKIWIPSKDQAWELATLVSVSEATDEVTVEGSDGIATIPKSSTHRTDPTHFEDTEDLCSMNHLHEAPLLDCLRRRFNADTIYTTTGDVLISVNPYKAIPGLYDNILSYLDVPEDGEIDKAASKPHVYKIANYSLQELLYGKKSNLEASVHRNQSIVVSGESGAGKTEASKQVMSFLIEADQEINTASTDLKEAELAQKIGVAIRNVLLESNIIFEAFGNAKTVRNDNSSRFGKYIKLQYSEENRIISAFTETFLLEKSRLVSISPNERNYHVFYQFLSGNTDESLRNELKLYAPENFRMLCDASGTAVKSSEDAHFGHLCAALTTLGCSDEELRHLWTILAAILHMGNICCEPSADESGTVKIISPTMPVSELTALLGVSDEIFESRLTTQRVKVSTRRSVTVKVLKDKDVLNNISALVKWMYSCAFSWLVKKINFAHCSVSEELEDARAVNFIGILDIFGFEILQNNSFEQLCINFTNERLQQQFNEYVFDREQAIYRAEGLDWDSINYKDNQHVIDLIGKKPTGILNILEEQGMLNRGAMDEGALLSSFNQMHDKKSTAYEKSRFTNDGRFIIRHFAGDVTYNVAGFLEKNNDSLQEDLMELMICSSNPFIQNAIVATGLDQPGAPDSPGYIGQINPDMIVASAGTLSSSARPGVASAAGGADKPAAAVVARGRRQSLMSADGAGKKLATTVTVSFQFRSQLDILLMTLRGTSPHYIKCIKPNALKVPHVFDSAMVLEQLRYSGALEVVRIRQEGFPICLPFVTFYETFETLSYGRQWNSPLECTTAEAKTYCGVMCAEVLASRDYQLGHTKVFMRTDGYENMHKAIATFLGKKVTKFQTMFRKRRAMHRFRTAVKGIRFMQSYVRMHLRRKWYRITMAEAIAAREREAERIREEARLANLAAEEAKRLAKEACDNRILALHTACTEGDLPAVQAALESHAEDYDVRNEHSNNCSVLQSAILSGNLELLTYLNPKLEELNCKDAQGNVAIHYAAMCTKDDRRTDVLRFLANIVQPEHSAVEAALQGLSIRPQSMSLPRAPPTKPSRRTSLADGLIRSETALESTAALLVNGNTATGAANGTILKQGWLSKRGESTTWRKRWVVLTNESLMYFRNSKDKVARDTISFSTRNDITVERTPGRPTAIDIHTKDNTSVTKNRSRVSMMAETEQEIQSWMNLLKAAAGVESSPLRTTGKAVHLVSPAVRHALFSLVNANKDTALHLLAKSESGSGDTVDSLLTASWLLDNGCPVSTFNHRGLTPLHVALQSNNHKLAVFLARKGANPATSVSGAAGSRSSVDMAKSPQLRSHLTEAFDRFESSVGVFLSAPPRLRGFHYLSLIFGKHIIKNEMHYVKATEASQYQLVVSTFSDSHALVETAQTTCTPVVATGAGGEQVLLWLDEYHLQFPLDNVNDGSYVIVEFKRRVSAVEETLSWGFVSLDKSQVDSRMLRVDLLTPPRVLSSAKPAGHALSPSQSSLEIEVVLSKRTGKETALF